VEGWLLCVYCTCCYLCLGVHSCRMLAMSCHAEALEGMCNTDDMLCSEHCQWLYLLHCIRRSLKSTLLFTWDNIVWAAIVTEHVD
jgi:hypothetical protein